MIRVSVLRIDKSKKQHLTLKELGSMLERMKHDKKKNGVENLRQRIVLNSVNKFQFPLEHELPHIYPTIEMERDANDNLRMKTFNGILLLTTRVLTDEKEVEQIKQTAMLLPTTIAAVKGASGLTVKILVSICDAEEQQPQTEEQATEFYKKAYALVFPTYNALLSQKLKLQDATLRNCFCLTLDPNPCYNIKATPFKVDSSQRLSEIESTVAEDTPSEAPSGYEPDEEVASATQALVEFLTKKYEFRFNTVMGYTEYHGRKQFEFMPVDERTIYSFAIDARLSGLNVRDNDVRRFVCSNKIMRYDPVDEYLWQVHGKWDGRDHIRALARTVPNDNPHWEDWFYTWFLGMVAQWRGGIKRYGNSVAPLLVSKQGYNKSTFCRSLIPLELQWGYNDNINLAEKRQVLQMMSQFLLINLDEFNSISPKVQQGFLKNIIQLASVKIKRPYGRHVEEFPRLASFIATANMTDILTDPTGNRRFIGIELTGPIDVSTPPNYEQLYAQAQAALDRGERYWFDAEQTRLIMENNRKFEWHSSTEEFFMDYFDVAENEQEGEYMNASTILELLKKKVGRGININNTAVFGRFLTNIEGIKARRIGNKGTEYLVRKKFD